MQKQEIINLILSLGFHSESTNDSFVREYEKHGYTISVNFQKKKIIYPPPIQIGDETTTNFSHPENFVVLECVDRLLKKGYRPGDLHLEKKWSLGRTQKSGKADITIKGQDGNTILIIECSKPFVDMASSRKGTSLPRIGIKDFMNLTVKYPDKKSHADVVRELLNYEQLIAKLKSKIAEAETKKAAILDKYLK